MQIIMLSNAIVLYFCISQGGVDTQDIQLCMRRPVLRVSLAQDDIVEAYSLSLMIPMTRE